VSQTVKIQFLKRKRLLILSTELIEDLNYQKRKLAKEERDRLKELERVKLA